MKKIYDMSAAEMEVMEKLWEYEEGIKQATILFPTIHRFRNSVFPFHKSLIF